MVFMIIEVKLSKATVRYSILFLFLGILTFSTIYFFNVPKGNSQIQIGDTNLDEEKEKPIEKIIYTPNSKNDCIDGKCSLKIYSDMMFSDSNGTLLIDTKSLKNSEFNYAFFINKTEDKNYPVEVIDYNLTSITLKFTITDSQIKKDIPLDIYETSNTTNKYLSTNLKSQTVGTIENTYIISSTMIGKTLKFGSNSTTIQLQPNTTNLMYDMGSGSLSGSNCDPSGAAISDASYSSVATAENTYWNHSMVGASVSFNSWRYSCIRFVYNLTYMPNGVTINSMNWTWEGYHQIVNFGAGAGTAKDYYIKNLTSGSYLDSGDYSTSEARYYINKSNVNSNFYNTSALSMYGLRSAGQCVTGAGCVNAGINILTDYTLLEIAYTLPDTTFPTYTNNESTVANNTAVNTGASINYSAKWSDDISLDKCVNSSKVNTSGSWVNGTWASAGTGGWTNYSVYFPAEQSSNLTVKIYCNDTSNNMNVTGLMYWYNVSSQQTYVSISLSTDLTNGITFGSLDPLDVNTSSSTCDEMQCNITVSADTTVNVDIKTKVNAYLTNGANTIQTEYWNSSTVEQPTNPLAQFSTSYDTTNLVGENIAANGVVIFNTWVSVPELKAPGTYNNTISFCAEETGESACT